MKRTLISPIPSTCFGVLLFILPVPAAHSQETVPPAGNASLALAQMTTAFAGSHAVQSIQLSGAVSWYAGSLKDSGTVILTAATSGSSQMQLTLDATGQITESQTGKGLSAKCQWSGKNSVVHNVDVGNCLRPALWFLPALSIQPSALSKQQVFTDRGQGAVGSSETIYHHLQGQIVPSGSVPSSKALGALIQQSTTDLGLDPNSLLPAVLTYSVHPNDGAPVLIPIEIHYSDYRLVSGVQLPFHIERYVNGSLQLDIRVSSAQVN